MIRVSEEAGYPFGTASYELLPDRRVRIEFEHQPDTEYSAFIYQRIRGEKASPVTPQIKSQVYVGPDKPLHLEADAFYISLSWMQGEYPNAHGGSFTFGGGEWVPLQQIAGEGTAKSYLLRPVARESRVRVEVALGLVDEVTAYGGHDWWITEKEAQIIREYPERMAATRAAERSALQRQTDRERASEMREAAVAEAQWRLDLFRKSLAQAERDLADQDDYARDMEVQAQQYLDDTRRQSAENRIWYAEQVDEARRDVDEAEASLAEVKSIAGTGSP